MPVLNTDGKVLYRFESISEAGEPGSGWPGMLLRLIGTIFILFWLHLVAMGVHRHFGTRKSILFLLTSILTLRGASYLFPIPIDFRRYELFNPVIYGSSPILKSLGDVLINALLFAWIMLFVRSLTHGKAPGMVVRSASDRAAGAGASGGATTRTSPPFTPSRRATSSRIEPSVPSIPSS